MSDHHIVIVDQSLMSLFRSGLIGYNEALMHCSNPSDFEREVRGIASTSDARWDNFEKIDGAGDRSGNGLDIERFCHHRGPQRRTEASERLPFDFWLLTSAFC